jgi:hypothetical protein
MKRGMSGKTLMMEEEIHGVMVAERAGMAGGTVITDLI